MNKEPMFNYDKESGITQCVITDGKNVFLGMAHCCDEDKDMQSEYTGCHIALSRAKIQYLMHVRDNEILPALKALKHTYYTMNLSKNFNPKSYENKMLWKSIHSKEFDLAVVRQMLIDERKDLKQYIDDKEKSYKRIRGHRKEDEIGQKQID